MTNAPADLAAFRTGVVIPLTGLQGGDVGIAPDAAHLASGGYHVGPDDIRRVGKDATDYSVRQGRDKIAGNLASAMDIGDNWPRGGRAAWLRFNNLLVTQLRARDPELAALRAANFSPDGSACRRYDSFNPGTGVVSSTDSVYMHTHLEWWRDTAGTPARARSLARVGQIIDAAIRNAPLEDVDMDARQAEQNANADTYLWKLITLQDQIDGILSNGNGTKQVVPNVLGQTVKKIEAQVAALAKAVGAPVQVELEPADLEAIAQRAAELVAQKLVALRFVPDAG